MRGLTFVRWSRPGGPVLNRLKGGALLAGLAWALSVTVAACVVMCAWVVLSAGPVYHFSAFVAAGALLGALAGGTAAGKAAGTLGATHGFLAGSLYGLLLIVLFTAGSPEGFSMRDLAGRAALLGAAGTAGGVLGVNSRPYQRRSMQKTGDRHLK